MYIASALSPRRELSVQKDDTNTPSSGLERTTEGTGHLPRWRQIFLQPQPIWLRHLTVITKPITWTVFFILRILLIILASSTIYHVVLERVPLFLVWIGGHILFAAPLCIAIRCMFCMMAPSHDYEWNKCYPLAVRNKVAPRSTLVSHGTVVHADRPRFNIEYTRNKQDNPVNSKDNSGVSREGDEVRVGNDLSQGFTGGHPGPMNGTNAGSNARRNRWVVVAELVCASFILFFIHATG